MQIRKVRLTDFKRHAELVVEPAAGLTIIRGPNEAGKSTIQTALELGLFRKADSMARDVQSLQRWSSAEPPEVEIDFEVDSKPGHLQKRFAGARAVAELSYDGRSTQDYAQIEERISELTGIPTESFFRATGSVGHAGLDQVAGDEPNIQDRLQKAISGADRGTAAAKKKLNAAIHRYRTEGHKNPGLIKVNRTEVELLQGELAAGEQALARLETDRAIWVEAHERRVGLDVVLERQQAELSEARQAELLATERDAAQSRYERLRRASALVEQEDQLRQMAPTQIPLAALRSGVANAGNLELDLSELEAELSVSAEAVGGGDADQRPPRAWRWVLIAGAMAIVAALVWLLLGGVIGALAAVGLAIGTVLASVRAVRAAVRARQYELAHRLAQSATEQRQETGLEYQEAFRRKRRELEQQLGAIGVASVAQGRQLLSAAEAHNQELVRIEGELDGLGIEERIGRRLEAERDEAANAAERARHALAAMGKVADDPTAVRKEAQRQVEVMTPARDQARSQEDQAHGRVEANPVDADVISAMAERLIVARELQAGMEQRLAIYVDTLEAIESAERATLKTAARFLEERMGPAIEHVTDGRYAEIEVDERNLAFRVRVPETGEFVDVTALSQGTADQLFLTARLGLVRLVTMDRRPPLILDDPFVTFDAARGERALRLVKQVAAEQGFQVLYLTCSDRFDNVADKVIMLPGPSVDDAVMRTVAERTEAAAPAPTSDDFQRILDELPEPDAADPFGLGGDEGSRAAG